MNICNDILNCSWMFLCVGIILLPLRGSTDIRAPCINQLVNKADGALKAAMSFLGNRDFIYGDDT